MVDRSECRNRNLGSSLGGGTSRPKGWIGKAINQREGRSSVELLAIPSRSGLDKPPFRLRDAISKIATAPRGMVLRKEIGRTFVMDCRSNKRKPIAFRWGASSDHRGGRFPERTGQKLGHFCFLVARLLLVPALGWSLSAPCLAQIISVAEDPLQRALQPVADREKGGVNEPVVSIDAPVVVASFEADLPASMQGEKAGAIVPALPLGLGAAAPDLGDRSSPQVPESIVPGDPIDPLPLPQTWSAEQVGRLAGQRAAASELFLKQSQLAIAAHYPKDDAPLWLKNVFQLLAEQIRLRAIRGARTAHHQLVAVERSIAVLEETAAFLERSIAGQDRLVEQGVAVKNPYALRIQLLELRQKRSELVQQSSQLRIALSGTIGSDPACQYQPLGEIPEESAIALCDLQSLALRSRGDLVALRLVHAQSTTREMWLISKADDWTGPWQDFPFVTTSIARKKSFWSHLFGPDLDQLLAHKKKLLADVHDQIQEKLVVDLESSWNDRQGALERWNRLEELQRVRQERLRQLEALAEKGQPDFEQQVVAKLELLQGEGDRWKLYAAFWEADQRLSGAVGSQRP
jgi:hypothetical protein